MMYDTANNEDLTMLQTVYLMLSVAPQVWGSLRQCF